MSDDPVILAKRQAARKALRELDAKFDKQLQQILANPSGTSKQSLDQLKEYARERNDVTEALFKLYDDDPPKYV